MAWTKILKELRNKLLLSQTEMAKLLDVSFASINRYENGHHEPTIKVKRKVKLSATTIAHQIPFNPKKNGSRIRLPI